MVYNSSLNHHYIHLEQVFFKLATRHFHAKTSKCTFAINKISYLGHIISSTGIEADPGKLDAVQNWPKPANLTILCSFLGLTSYYRRFMPKYTTIAVYLPDILRKPHFAWSPEAQSSSQNLNTAMFHLITLTLPDYIKIVDKTTDASNISIGAILYQQDRPISFFSKRLCNCMKSDSLMSVNFLLSRKL